jgi:hypothetical protein
LPIPQPTTLFSDLVLAAVALVLAVRLHRAGPWSEGRARRLWSAAFAAGAAAALAGGIVHGFEGSLAPLVRGILWKIVLVGTGLAGSLLLAGTALAIFRGPWRTGVLAAVAGQLVVYLLLASGTNDVRLAVGNGALTILALLVLVLATAFHAPRRLAFIVLALGLSAAALFVQRTGLAAGILNHNDICHLLQTAALLPFYLVGRRLADRGAPVAASA